MTNKLLNLESLQNRYFGMRHGHSEANELGIIVSQPEHGVAACGLSDSGRSQVQATLDSCALPGADTRIVSSDFKRARETAEIACRHLLCTQPVSLDIRLRERSFGDFELGSDQNYPQLWAQDRLDPDSRHAACESANAVMTRVTAVVAGLEDTCSGGVFLLVSHGDALQILQTALLKREASCHRDIDHMETAEIRPLLLAP